MIHHRQQLINFLEQNVTDRVLQKAMNWGQIEFLGGFNPLFGSLLGWCVSITSYRGTTYNIGIIEDVNIGKLRWFRLTKIPWENWDGDRSEDKLYQGDKPEKYRRLKNEKNKS